MFMTLKFIKKRPKNTLKILLKWPKTVKKWPNDNNFIYFVLSVGHSYFYQKMWTLLNKHTSVSFNNNWDTFLLFTFPSACKCFLTSHTLQNNIVPSVENTFSPNCVTYRLKRLAVDTFCFGISIALRNVCTSQVTSILWVTSYKTKDSCFSIVGGTPEFQGAWRRSTVVSHILRRSLWFHIETPGREKTT